MHTVANLNRFFLCLSYNRSNFMARCARSCHVSIRGAFSIASIVAVVSNVTYQRFQRIPEASIALDCIYNVIKENWFADLLTNAHASFGY